MTTCKTSDDVREACREALDLFSRSRSYTDREGMLDQFVGSLERMIDARVGTALARRAKTEKRQ